MALPLSPETDLVAMVLDFRLLPQSNLDLCREQSQETELRESAITVYNSGKASCCVML